MVPVLPCNDLLDELFNYILHVTDCYIMRSISRIQFARCNTCICFGKILVCLLLMITIVIVNITGFELTSCDL